MAAVSQGLEDAIGGVVQHQGQQAAAVHPEIGDGVGHNVLRRAHPPQDGGCEEYAQNGQDHPGNEGEDDGGMDGSVHLVLLPGAVVSGDENAGPYEGALEKVNDEEAQAA